MFQLASYHLERYRDQEDPADLEEALRRFAQLRQEYPDREDYIDSSWFKPALALYSRGKPEEIEQAASLLKQLEKARPDGPLHLAALFWLGRIAAESGKEQEAKTFLTIIIRQCPYDYYATRARLHLQPGNRAAQELNPDAKTRAELQAAYRRSKDQHLTLSEKPPYHLRLQAALQSGSYYRALRSYIDFRNAKFPSSRLESIPLDKLDESHRLPHVALMLSWRQDALAAVDTPSTSRNRLEVAKTLSEFKAPDWPSGDWPLVIYISGATDQPDEVKSKTQNDPAFLAIAYPKTFGPIIEKYSDANLPGALLYAIIRHESAFETTALSPAGALGLFQFIPRTFDVLDSRYHLLSERKKSSREEFLLNPYDSVYLGALWLRKELKVKMQPGQDNNLLWALMEHNAGLSAVREWKRKWQRLGRADDYEYIIDSVRYAETRTFTRAVVNTYWIMQAAGIYGGVR